MDKKYCEIGDVEAYTLSEIAGTFSDEVEEWIKGATRFIDNLANRSLVAPVIGSGDDEFEDRYYDGTGVDYLIIDNCQEINEIKIGDYYGDSLTINSSYITFPKSTPYRRVVLKDTTFTEGIQNVTISGRWGYFNTVPADVKLACAIIVAGIINSQNPSNQVKKSESIGDYSVSYLDDKGIADYAHALEIIGKYKLITF